MTTKRYAPVLLAATLALAGASGAFLGAVTPAHAITSVDELSDVNRNHWAFEALQDLVEKYDVIEGYPDKTFRGNKAPTRWEMAAALNALIKSVGRDLARLGAEKANKSDLATLAKLQDEFRNELSALNARTSALEGRATAIEAKNAEQDNRLSLLERTQLHGDMSFGGIADIAANGPRIQGSGADDGIRDGISAIGRLRLTLDVPVKEDRDDSLIGEGSIHARLVAAFGRTAPLGGQDGNLGQLAGFTGYSRIAGDASAFNEGISPSSLQNGVITAGGNALRANLYVENVFYKQHFKSGIPVLTNFFPGLNVLPESDDWKTTGDLYLGLIPWRYLFDKSPYRGNELTQFQNTAFVNIPGVPVNSVTPTVAYQWHQGLGKNFGLDLTGAVSSFNTSDLLTGLNANYEARLNYQTAFLGPNFTKPGSLYAGGYNVWQSGNQRLTSIDGLSGLLNRSLSGELRQDKSSLNGFYAGWSQEFYKGIGTTFNYSFNNGGPTNYLLNSSLLASGANINRLNSLTGVGVRQSLSGVLNIPVGAIVPGFRDKDALGVGYALVNMFRSGYSAEPVVEGGVANFGKSSWEQVAEVYYRFQLTDAISVIPSYQLIFNRFGVGANDHASVIGLRTNYVF